MAQNHIQEGKVLTWTNSTGSDVSSGSAVLVGALLCVALVNIADGASGEVATEQVFELPKTAGEAWAMGAQLYYDESEGEVTTTSTDNTACGKAAAAAASAATVGNVKLNA